MNPELLFAIAVALLPVAAWSGWLFARRAAVAGNHRQRDQRIVQECCKGINYLLEEQPDKAIEAITEVLRTDDETIETHFALAALFRRRGEADRAIRIHQALLKRPNVDTEHRFHAMYELGVDYLRAGLLDRAEHLFRELHEAGRYRAKVLRHLVDLYQREQDWDQAIATIEKLQDIDGGDYRAVHAHLLCERAERLLQDDVPGARRGLRKALATDPHGPRANLLLARLALQERDYRCAIEHLRAVAEQDVEFISETIEPLLVCYREMARDDELIGYLVALTTKANGIGPAMALAQLHVEGGRMQAGIDVLIAALASQPTLRGVDLLIEYLLRLDGNRELSLIQDSTRRLIAGREQYLCRKCGFLGRELHWQCPGCRTWGTVKPRQGTGEN